MIERRPRNLCARAGPITTLRFNLHQRAAGAGMSKNRDENENKSAATKLRDDEHDEWRAGRVVARNKNLSLWSCLDRKPSAVLWRVIFKLKFKSVVPKEDDERPQSG
jgi:hypothetical protein